MFVPKPASVQTLQVWGGGDDDGDDVVVSNGDIDIPCCRGRALLDLGRVHEAAVHFRW